MRTINNCGRGTLLIALALGLLLVTTEVSATERPNFTGTWLLVKEKSSNLPDIFGVTDEYLLIINQKDDNSIAVSTEIHGRGQTISSEPDLYPINGTAVEKLDQRGVKLKRSFRYDEASGRLLVDTEKRFTGQIQLPDTDESEVWELSDQGKFLTITITPKTTQSQKQVRVFVKRSQEGE
ncbi:MAG: hypothetical protein AB1489_10905 [Acidobacteriota bacterium]